METCKHFGVCGGCSFQHIPYDEQLKNKEENVRKALASLQVEEFLPVIASPDIWFYRNKMEFAFGDGGGEGILCSPSPLGGEGGGEGILCSPSPLRGEGGGEGVSLGLRQRKKFDKIVNLEECPIFSPDMTQLFETVRLWAKARGLAGYDLRKHTGMLRYLVVREGKYTSQRLLNFITNGDNLPLEQVNELIDMLKKANVNLTTLTVTSNQGVADVARGNIYATPAGAGYIEERLGRLNVRINPWAFFQPNPKACLKIYEFISELAGTGDTLLDVYCGMATIGLFLSGSFKEVIGIESENEAVETARQNAVLNGINNVAFICGKAEDILRNSKELDSRFKHSGMTTKDTFGDMSNGNYDERINYWHPEDISLAIVDPPRCGMHPKALENLMKLGTERVIYVSCNPNSLATDLSKLSPIYKIKIVRPVDMFPHTPHVEIVTLLTLQV